MSNKHDGDALEVLEPLWLRQEIADMVKRMWSAYKTEKKTSFYKINHKNSRVNQLLCLFLRLDNLRLWKETCL